MKRFLITLALVCYYIIGDGQVVPYQFGKTVSESQSEVTFKVYVFCDSKKELDQAAYLAGIRCVMFEGCSGAVTFASTFERCSSLKSIPEGLFDYSPGAKIFTNIFNQSGLETVPAGLFSACPDAQDFRETFRECSSLTSLPAGLFDNNRSVTDFGLTFWGCWILSGETPYTVIDGKKVHLYERIDWPDYFVSPIHYEGCFNAEGLSDIEAIRSAGWS